MDIKPIRTRFAPSPTGVLHLGSARTALFNWMFARASNGKFFIRIEDTDRQRSTDNFVTGIRDGLEGLNLDWDGDITFQSDRWSVHVKAAYELLDKGQAYKCFCSPRQIEEYRSKAKSEGRPVLFQSPWRDIDPSAHPDDEFTIRLKSPLSGETAVEDAIKGKVTWKNESLDDLVIVRADGSPTYNFSVVLDDHATKISHVIRGDDHLANTPKQKLVYEAFGWEMPVFVHLPLILDEDGRKLSKRGGSESYLDYLAQGIPVSAMQNYLLRLGWSHGDTEVFTTEDALDWFGLEGLGRSPARLNRKKLEWISSQHIGRLLSENCLQAEFFRYRAHYHPDLPPLPSKMPNGFREALAIARTKARNLRHLLKLVDFVVRNRPIWIDDEARAQLNDRVLRILTCIEAEFSNTGTWCRSDLDLRLKAVAEKKGLATKDVFSAIRLSVAGSTVSLGVYELLEILGQEESMGRLSDSLKGVNRTPAQAQPEQDRGEKFSQTL